MKVCDLVQALNEAGWIIPVEWACDNCWNVEVFRKLQRVRAYLWKQSNDLVLEYANTGKTKQS